MRWSGEELGGFPARDSVRLTEEHVLETEEEV